MAWLKRRADALGRTDKGSGSVNENNERAEKGGGAGVSIATVGADNVKEEL